MHFKHEDKLQHITGGTLLSFTSYIVFYAYLDITFLHSIIIISILVTLIAVLFELQSLWTGWGYCDVYDAVATVIGIPIGIFLASMINYSI